MAVCYVETFILENACADALLLWLAAMWRGGRIRPARILIGSLIGTLWALAAAMGAGALRSAAAQGGVSLGMAWVALGKGVRAEALRGAGTLWLGAAALGGIAALGVPLALAGMVAGLAGLALLRRKNAPPMPTVTLFIRQGTVARAMEGFVDTGCRALDPWTCLPTLVIPEGDFTAPAGRALCVRTAAGARALPTFVPDEVRVNGTPVRAAVALAPRALLEGPLVPLALCAERKAQ